MVNFINIGFSIIKYCSSVYVLTISPINIPKEKELQVKIEKYWKNLHNRYSKILGEKEGAELTSIVYNSTNKLESKFND